MFKVGDKVLIKSLAKEGVIKEIIAVENGTRMFALMYDNNTAIPFDDIVLVQSSDVPVPLDVNQPVIKHRPTAVEEYNMNKDDRDEEFKKQILLDSEVAESLVVELTEEEVDEVLVHANRIVEIMNEAKEAFNEGE